MRLPFCPPTPLARSPDVPEGVVGLFVPTPSPVPVRGVEEPVPAAAVFLLAAEEVPVAAVCLGETSDVLDVPAATRLAFLTGVVGLELRPCPCGVFLPDDPGDDLGGVRLF